MSGADATLQNFSVQHLVDCDTVNLGCGGGWMYDAFDYVKQHGIALRDDYPTQYLSRQSSCKYNTGTMSHFKNLGMVEEDGNTNQRLKEIVSQ